MYECIDQYGRVVASSWCRSEAMQDFVRCTTVEVLVDRMGNDKTLIAERKLPRVGHPMPAAGGTTVWIVYPSELPPMQLTRDVRVDFAEVG